jgi:hypothetical protein
MSTKTYDRNLRDPRAYQSTAIAYALQWPSYNHYILYDPWEESTVTGTL